MTRRSPVVFTGDAANGFELSHGTQVEIAGLRSRWFYERCEGRVLGCNSTTTSRPASARGSDGYFDRPRNAPRLRDCVPARDGVDLLLRDEEGA